MDIKVRDSNGATLAEGDTVTLIKDLKLKGSSTVLKRGTVIRGIHLTDDPGRDRRPHRQGQGPGAGTEFLKKAWNPRRPRQFARLPSLAPIATMRSAPPA